MCIIPDLVNHPPHYTSHPSGIECIEITRLCPFDMGNAIKYIWRYSDKNGLQDLDKARFCLKDLISYGLPHFPPYRAKVLLQKALQYEQDILRLKLLGMICHGRIQEAIDLIVEELDDSH